jgi:hypothetical protein
MLTFVICKQNLLTALELNLTGLCVVRKPGGKIKYIFPTSQSMEELEDPLQSNLA